MEVMIIGAVSAGVTAAVGAMAVWLTAIRGVETKFTVRDGTVSQSVKLDDALTHIKAEIIAGRGVKISSDERGQVVLTDEGPSE